MVATYQYGSVTAAELQEWRRYLGLEGRSATARQAIDDLVVVRALAAAAPPESEIGGFPERSHLERHRKEAAWLHSELVQEARPTDQEVRAALEARSEDFHLPKRWRLSNLFLRIDGDASDGQREGIRRRIEELRARIVSGEDFGEIAASESVSQTRRRAGDMGFVALDRLGGEIASVVEGMAKGDLSQVIELADGFLLLTCTGILEARTQTFDEARPGIAQRLFDQRLADLQSSLDERLHAEMSPELRDNVRWTDSEAMVAAFRMEGETRQLSVADIEAASPGRALVEMDVAERGAVVQERLLLEGRAMEARRRGCREDPDLTLRVEFAELERRAQIGANLLAAANVKEPSEEEIDHWIDENRERLYAPETRHLRAVRISRDPALGRDYFERLRLLGEELAGGSGDLSEVVEDLGPSAELVDFGWLGADQLWGLGRNVEHAALSLRVGQISELVQEGPKLYLLELVALRTKRDLSDEESRETGRAALLAASRRRAGKDLRLQILAKRQVVEDPGS